MCLSVQGNLHLNVVGETHSHELKECIEPFIFDWTARHGGSVSAEHGLGFMKAKYIYHSKSRETVVWMKKLKQLFDPNGILNPYKTLPPN
jgi:FAD/FMN-containing dehydrogenase